MTARNSDDCYGFIRSKKMENGELVSPSRLMYMKAIEYRNDGNNPVMIYQDFRKSNGSYRKVYYTIRDIDLFIENYYQLERDDGVYETLFDNNTKVKPYVEYIYEYKNYEDSLEDSKIMKQKKMKFISKLNRIYEYMCPDENRSNWVIMTYRTNRSIVFRAIMNNGYYFKNMLSQKRFMTKMVNELNMTGSIELSIYDDSRILLPFNTDPRWDVDPEWNFIYWKNDENNSYKDIMVKVYDNVEFEDENVELTLNNDIESEEYNAIHDLINGVKNMNIN
jgi:hypothetical protein